jgi:uncharacterized membrane protein
MSFAGLTLRSTDSASRWLLLASLALNLFFIGIGSAMLAQAEWTDTSEAPASSDSTLASRIDRIAATLPKEDGDRLRANYRAHQAEVDGPRAVFEQRRDAIHAALRAQPFDEAALRAAMAQARAARQTFDRTIQDFFAKEAAEMSPAGRQKLADWRGSRRRTQRNSGSGASKQ